MNEFEVSSSTGNYRIGDKPINFGCRRGVVVNTLVAINDVALRRARLLLGWVTVWKQHVTNHLGQLSLPSLMG